MEKEILPIEIENIRKRLTNITQYRTFNDPGILTLSKQLDNLIVKFQKYKAKQEVVQD